MAKEILVEVAGLLAEKKILVGRNMEERIVMTVGLITTARRLDTQEICV